MASIILLTTGAAVVGGLGGGPIASALVAGVLGTAGAYVDSRYLFPAFFPTPPIISGRLKELSLSQATEGSPVQYTLGQAIRIGGTPLWISTPNFITRKKVGKGGEQAVVQYRYYASVAVAAGKGPISKIKRVWADNYLIYSDEPVIGNQSNQITAKQVKISFADVTGVDIIRVYFIYLEITAPQVSINLLTLRTGANVTLSGFANAGNNGTFKVLRVRDNGDGTITVRMYNRGAVDEAAGQTITVAQDIPKFDKSRFDTITFYPGNQTQNPDPEMEADLGAGTVPAFRGTAYFVIKDLLLDYYGNRVPQFMVEVEQSPTMTIGEAISAIMLKYGYQSSDFDVTRLPATLFKGGAIEGPQQAVALLDPLMIAHNLVAQEVEGKIVFFERGSIAPITIAEGDLSAHTPDSDVPRTAELERIDAKRLPSEVVIRYRDEQNYGQIGSVRTRRINYVLENVMPYDLPLTLNAQNAADISARLMWQAWQNIMRFKIYVPPSSPYWEIEEGDHIEFPSYGKTFKCVVSEVTRGVGYIMEIVGAVEDISLFTGSSGSKPTDPSTVGVQSQVILELLDIAPLTSGEVTREGFYYAVAGPNDVDSWRGATIFYGEDPDNLVEQATVTNEAIIGETVLTVSQIEVISDDGTPANPGGGFSSPGGSQFQSLWETTTQGNDPWGGSSHVTSAENAVWVWSTPIASAGEYQVYIRYTPALGRSDRVKYSVIHLSGTYERYINQDDPGLSDEWILLGEFSFSGTARVEMTAGPDGTSCADAVRFVKQTAVDRLGPGDEFYWDLTNTITVQLLSRGELESFSDLEVLNGKNWALIGGEIVGFQVATLVSPGRYTLSKLLRGLRGTENAIDSHLPGERFVLLEPGTINFMPIQRSDIGQPRYIKAVTAGEVESNIEETRIIPRANTLRTFSPAHFIAYPDVNLFFGNGIQLLWKYRTRGIVRVFNTTQQGAGVIPLGQSNYIVKIRDSKGKLILAIPVNGSTNYHISNTTQAQSGIVPGQTLIIDVHEISDQFGEGLGSRVITTSTLV